MLTIQETHLKKITGLSMLIGCSIFLISSVKAQNAPLFAALKKNNIQELKTLLDQKANVNVYDDDSDHVLMYAAMYASADCMDLLIKNGANVNATNKSNEAPLMWCNHDIGKSKLLLQNKADINAVAKTGNTALLTASVGCGQYEMIKLLLDNGADALARNNKGETPLYRVALFGDTAAARLLLNKGAAINTRTDLKE